MNISIIEMADTDYDKVKELINFEDADADFLLEFKNREKNFNCVYNNDSLEGFHVRQPLQVQNPISIFSLIHHIETMELDTRPFHCVKKNYLLIMLSKL